MRVSLCMIVRDEHANLGGCLDSVAGLVHEVVVVDTGSTDGTGHLAQERGARVVDFPWTDDFAVARNESITHASCDWIFWLDADDRVERGSRAVLSALLGGLTETLDGYLMRCVSL